MKNMKRILLIVGVIATVFAMVGCNKSEVREDKLIVGLDDSFAPMGFRDMGGKLLVLTLI